MKVPLAAAILAACSGCSNEPQQNIVALVEPQSQLPEIVVDRVLFGAGLRGLAGYRATLLPGAEAARLFALAYPAQPITVTSPNGEIYNARPLAAIRTDSRTILIVQNQSSLRCHACPGRTSIFYFNRAGSSLTQSFPLALEGSDWGEPQEVQLVDLNGPSLLLRWDYQQGGHYEAGYVLYRLADDGVHFLGRFPSLETNDGTGDTSRYYSVQLAGAELAADGRAVTVRYLGYRNLGNEASTRQIEREQSVTLDGVDEAWLAEPDW